MENQDALLGIRLTGGGINPEKLRIREVAELLKYLEDAIYYDISAKYDDVNRDQVYLSITQIQDQSAFYGVTPSLEKLMVTSFLIITTAINTQDFSEVPVKSIENIQQIVKFGKRRNCNTEFKLLGEPMAVLEPDTVVTIPKSLFISGYTTIYPYVKRTGGSVPRVAIRINPNDPFIYVKTSEEIAKKLGERLYSVVGLNGFATWERKTRSLIEFKIESILPYTESAIDNTFDVLKNSIGKYWDEIDDVDAFLNEEFES